MKKVLILDKKNSCRGQMAYGYLKLYAGHKAEIDCLGIDKKHLDPGAIAILMEDGINLTENKPTTPGRYSRYTYDFILILSEYSEAGYSRLIDSNTIKLRHIFDDPAKVRGSEDNIYKAYEKTRDEIKAFCKEFAKTWLRPLE